MTPNHNALVTDDLPCTDGNPDSPHHNVWLLELGQATRAAAQLATTCFDLARIVGGIDGTEMYDDPLGGLQRRLEGIDASALPGMPPFLASLDTARRRRNDLAHAFLVRDGLLRRTIAGGYERSFYSVDELVEARKQMEAASRLGTQVLHAEGGSIVDGWRQEVP